MVLERKVGCESVAVVIIPSLIYGPKVVLKGHAAKLGIDAAILEKKGLKNLKANVKAECNYIDHDKKKVKSSHKFNAKISFVVKNKQSR